MRHALLLLLLAGCTLETDRRQYASTVCSAHAANELAAAYCNRAIHCDLIEPEDFYACYYFARADAYGELGYGSVDTDELNACVLGLDDELTCKDVAAIDPPYCAAF